MGSKWESDHLWLCLLALGFYPKYHSGVRLGRDMFVKPNNRAFTAVALFLFTKLDKHRAKRTFKKWRCTKLASPRFRRQCCVWLREIANHTERGIPRITPSTLICPGGAKFIHVVYRFARYVMIEDMRKLSAGTAIPFAKALMRRPEDMYIAKARHRVACNKLLQIIQREDFIIQEYGRKARVLIRETEWTKSKCAAMQKQSWRMKQNNQNKNDTTERIQKVRSMWTLIVETLTSIKKEKDLVDSVLADCVHPCLLDGTDVVFHVPRLLTYSVESNIYGFCTANMYEDEKLNFLTVIQLVNEALCTLRDEHCPCKLKEPHRIGDMVASCKRLLRDLNTRSLREHRHCEQKHPSVSGSQENWESKWRAILGQCPFYLLFEDDLETALPFQYSNSSDEDESLSGFYYSLQEHDEKDDEALDTVKEVTFVPSGCLVLSPFLRKSSVPSLSEESETSDLLIENNLQTCVGNKTLVPPRILKNGKEEFPTSEMKENPGKDVSQPKSPVKKEDLLEKARDELAEEVAKSVMSESPDTGEEKGMPLDDLISSLSFNPFLTRKQIPRTPENLLIEIRSSWRKAIQTEGSLDTELSSAEVVTEKSSINATLSKQEEVDSTLVCSEPASSSVSVKKSQLSSTESIPEEQVSMSHTFESSDSKTSGIQESERSESEKLDCSALNGSFVEDLSQTLQNKERSIDIPDTCLESSRKTNRLLSDHCRIFQSDEKLCTSLSLLNSIIHETDMGILDETLPESDSIDLSISADSFFYTMDGANVTGGSENNEDIKKLDIDIQSLSSSHEVLKRTASQGEEELHQTHNGDEAENYRYELSPIPEEIERYDDDAFVDEGFTKTPLPASSNEGKYSLSSLLITCKQLEEVVHEVPLDLPHKLKDKNS